MPTQRFDWSHACSSCNICCADLLKRVGSPSRSEVLASTERTGLWVDDCEVWRLHYYWTLRNWRLRFADKRAAVVVRMGERFARMWEFYLGAAELGFLHGSNMVFQLLVSERRDDVPVLRDYMFDDERALRANGH